MRSAGAFDGIAILLGVLYFPGLAGFDLGGLGLFEPLVRLDFFELLAFSRVGCLLGCRLYQAGGPAA